MDSAGTYTVRILPLAPVEQPDGSYKLERKGYEYPVKTQVLKLDNPRPTGKKTNSSLLTFVIPAMQGYL